MLCNLYVIPIDIYITWWYTLRNYYLIFTYYENNYLDER